MKNEKTLIKEFKGYDNANYWETYNFFNTDKESFVNRVKDFSNLNFKSKKLKREALVASGFVNSIFQEEEERLFETWAVGNLN